MSVWHRHLSVSAALPTTGSALSDKYKHSLPGPAFLSQRLHADLLLASSRSWHQMLKRVRSQSETLRWDDSEWEVLCQLSLQHHFPSEWKYLQSNYTKSVYPVASLLTKWLTPYWQTLTHKHVKTLYKTLDSLQPALTSTRGLTVQCVIVFERMKCITPWKRANLCKSGLLQTQIRSS